MRSTLFIFSVVFTICLVPSTVSAQGEADPDQSTATRTPTFTRVAQVDIFNPHVAHYQGTTNTYTLAFTLANAGKTQPDVHYGVELWAPESGEMVHRRVFGSTSLGAGEQRPVREPYRPPEHLDGEYQPVMVAMTSGGLRLARMPLSSALTLTATRPYAHLTAKQCAFEEVDSRSFVEPAAALNLRCQVTNLSTTALTLTPQTQLRRESVLVEPISTTVHDQNIELAPGESATFTLPVTAGSKPGMYYTTLALQEDGVRVSNEVTLSYRVNGMTGVIRNVRLDKDFYESGDTASVEVYWDGAARYRRSATTTPLSEPTFELVVMNADGEKCTDAKTVVAKQAVVTTTLPVKRRCYNPQLSVSFSSEGEELASRTFGTSSSSTPATSRRAAIWAGVTVIVLVIAAGVGGFLWYRRRRTRSGSKTFRPTDPTNSSLALLVGFGLALSFAFGGAPDAVHAETWVVDYYDPTGGEGTVTTNLNRSVYREGGQIRQTVEITKPTDEDYQFDLFARWRRQSSSVYSPWKPSGTERCEGEVASCNDPLYNPESWNDQSDLPSSYVTSYLRNGIQLARILHPADRMQTRREWADTRYPWADWVVTTEAELVSGEYAYNYSVLDMMILQPSWSEPDRWSYPLILTYRVFRAPDPTAALYADTDTDPNNGKDDDEVTIERGETAYLHWESSNANGCSSGDFDTGGARSGTALGVSPTATTTYTINCDGAFDSVTVNVKDASNPGVTLYADDDQQLNDAGDPTPAATTSFSVPYSPSGEIVWLTWRSNEDVESCASDDLATHGGSPNDSPDGQLSEAVFGDTTFSIECRAADGTAVSDDVTVTVGSASISVLRVDESRNNFDSLQSTWAAFDDPDGMRHPENPATESLSEGSHTFYVEDKPGYTEGVVTCQLPGHGEACPSTLTTSDLNVLSCNGTYCSYTHSVGSDSFELPDGTTLQIAYIPVPQLDFWGERTTTSGLFPSMLFGFIPEVTAAGSMTVDVGESVDLMWDVSNAEWCDASWTSESMPSEDGQHSEGPHTFSTAGTYNFSMTCGQGPHSDPHAQTTDNFTIYVTGSGTSGDLSCKAVGPDGAGTAEVGDEVHWQVMDPEAGTTYMWYDVSNSKITDGQTGTDIPIVYDTVGVKTARVEIPGESDECETQITIDPDYEEF